MNSTEKVMINSDSSAGPCLVPREVAEYYQRSNRSARSVRNKIQARYSPDVVWFQDGLRRYHHYSADVIDIDTVQVLSGGDHLQELIGNSDNLLVAMRKIAG